MIARRRATTDVTRTLGRTWQIGAVAIALAWSLGPIYWMLATSFKTELEANQLMPTWWPESPTIQRLRGSVQPIISFCCILHQ